jgi:hypothetical protein
LASLKRFTDQAFSSAGPIQPSIFENRWVFCVFKRREVAGFNPVTTRNSIPALIKRNPQQIFCDTALKSGMLALLWIVLLLRMT